MAGQIQMTNVGGNPSLVVSQQGGQQGQDRLAPQARNPLTTLPRYDRITVRGLPQITQNVRHWIGDVKNYSINRTSLTSDLRWTGEPFTWKPWTFFGSILLATAILVLLDPDILALMRDRKRTTETLKKYNADRFEKASPGGVFFFQLFGYMYDSLLYTTGPIYFLFWLVFVHYMNMGTLPALFFTICLVIIFSKITIVSSPTEIYAIFSYEDIAFRSLLVLALVFIFYVSNTYFTIFIATILSAIIKESILFSIVHQKRVK